MQGGNVSFKSSKKVKAPLKRLNSGKLSSILAREAQG